MRSNPFIPQPKRTQQADTELLIKQPEKHVDTRPTEQKLPQYIKIPHYNDLYDSLGTKQAWRYVCDDQASGTLTTVAGSAVTANVNLSTPASMSAKFKMKQWPGGVQVFLVVRFFAFGPSTASFATAGEINLAFTDQFGNILPLGIAPNNNFYNFTETSVLPTPITDSAPSLPAGILSATLNAAATVGNYAWQFGFSYAYLLPAKKGFSWEILHGHYMH